MAAGHTFSSTWQVAGAQKSMPTVAELGHFLNSLFPTIPFQNASRVRGIGLGGARIGERHGSPAAELLSDVVTAAEAAEEARRHGTGHGRLEPSPPAAAAAAGACGDYQLPSHIAAKIAESRERRSSLEASTEVELEESSSRDRASESGRTRHC